MTEYPNDYPRLSAEDISAHVTNILLGLDSRKVHPLDRRSIVLALAQRLGMAENVIRDFAEPITREHFRVLLEENTRLKPANKRIRVLLEKAAEYLEAHAPLDHIIIYDDSECDGVCLVDDIRTVLSD